MSPELHVNLLSNGAVVGGTSTSKNNPFYSLGLNPITLSLNQNAPELKGGMEIDRCFFLHGCSQVTLLIVGCGCSLIILKVLIKEKTIQQQL